MRPCGAERLLAGVSGCSGRGMRLRIVEQEILFDTFPLLCSCAYLTLCGEFDPDICRC
eukprot:m.447942 g.447942  ORF g.447942 m.447942 type:complete len:58 (+) comp56884_c0_seq4:1759-1932(+)